jgi:hypothetical protein
MRHLLLRAKHLFVAAMVAWVHPRPAWRLWVSIIKVWVHVAWIDRGRWSASTVAVLSCQAASYFVDAYATYAGPGPPRVMVRRADLHPAPSSFRANALRAVTVGAFVNHSQGHETRLKPFFLWTKPHFGFSFEQYLCSR